MTYQKPQLTGYAAIFAVQGTGKGSGLLEPPSMFIRSTPAYEADE
jgi:hypothetical protein